MRIIKETSKQSAKLKQTISTTQSGEEALTSQDRAKMNHITINNTFSSSTFCLYLRNLVNISPDVRAVFVARMVVNALTFPLTTVLNILVMVALKTKPQLRTKSNIALACLSTTDLAVGLVVQPLHIASESLLLRGDIMFCTIKELSNTVTYTCLLASFNHLILMSAERYVAIKHPFTHETQVTEVRIIIVSALAWAAAIILVSTDLSRTATLIVSVTLLIILPIYFNVSAYKEVRRNRNQIVVNQVSLEAREKLLKKRKAFYTTVVVLLVISLCYIPTNISAFILTCFNERIPPNIKVIASYLITLLPVLNSLFNPLIYAIRLRNFRVAVIQLVSRNTIAKTEELKNKVGPRQIGVSGNVNAGHRTQPLSDEHEPKWQAEPHGGCQETPL